MKFEPQIFGKDCPPLYSIEDVLEVIDKITKLDEAINDLAIQREVYVKDLKQKVQKIKDNQNKD